MVFLTGAAAGWAETVYVVDVIRVGVRSGPGNEQKSVGLVESGNAVEMLKAGDEWSLIRAENGTEGYVMSRYLTQTPPAKFRLDQLQEKNKALAAQAAALQEENTRLKAENQALAATAAERQRDADELSRAFESFKQEASDVTALKAKNEALTEEVARQQQAIAQLENHRLDILNPTNLYWFLAGGGVLLVGFLVGLSVKRQRRWSSLA
jgi:SH3 domain protein